MIPAHLLPDQKAAMEEMAARKLPDGGHGAFHNAKPVVATPAERLSSIEQMRHMLYLLDPMERRMSIEDCAAALLEKAAGTTDA